MLLRGCLIAVIAIAAGAPGVFAQDQATTAVRGLAVQARDVVLNGMDRLVCGDSPCSAVTEQEKSVPPVSDDEAFQIAQTAILSGVAEHCGLDWQQQSFLPMMSQWRRIDGISDRKLALVGAVHGVVQAQTIDAFAAQGPCDEQTRNVTQQRLAQTRD